MHLHSIAQNHPHSNKMQLLNLHFPVINQLHNQLDIDKLFAHIPSHLEYFNVCTHLYCMYSVIYVSNSTLIVYCLLYCTILYWVGLDCTLGLIQSIIFTKQIATIFTFHFLSLFFCVHLCSICSSALVYLSLCFSFACLLLCSFWSIIIYYYHCCCS